MAEDLTDRLTDLSPQGSDGRRPVFGGVDRFHDPAWTTCGSSTSTGTHVLGLGASHQTGWTALLLDLLLTDPMSAAPLDLLAFGLEG